MAKRAGGHAAGPGGREDRGECLGVRSAVEHLKSLHDGDLGVIETIACGASAVPALRAILHEREPSGLYETRRRAVEALAALGAHEVLREFLRAPHEFPDPVEMSGVEAVINAAARQLGKLGDRHDLPLLMLLLGRKPSAGVIEAVGAFRHREALPELIRSLEEDFYRAAAETAIRRLARYATAGLMRSANNPSFAFGRETGASILRRRSVLALLLEIGPPGRWPSGVLCDLIRDRDRRIAAIACRLCLRSASASRRLQGEAVRRLLELRTNADRLLSIEIDESLAEHRRSNPLVLPAARTA